MERVETAWWEWIFFRHDFRWEPGVNSAFGTFGADFKGEWNPNRRRNPGKQMAGLAVRGGSIDDFPKAAKFRDENGFYGAYGNFGEA